MGPTGQVSHWADFGDIQAIGDPDPVLGCIGNTGLAYLGYDRIE